MPIQLNMVQLAISSLVGFLALLQPVIASQRDSGPTDDSTCTANNKLYRSGNNYRMNGADYTVRCARGSSGSYFSTHNVWNHGFAECFDACELTEGCGGFSYVGDGFVGKCHFKGKVGGYYKTPGNVVTCEKSPKRGGKPEPIPSSSASSAWSTVTSSSSSASVASSSASSYTSPSTWSFAASSSAYVDTSSSASTSAASSYSSSEPSRTSSSASDTYVPTPTPSTIDQCQQAVKTYGEVYRSSSGSSYKLACGEDSYGGDLSNAGSSTFLGCIDICDAKPDCLGYSYTSGICWLKASLIRTRPASGVDFARNLGRNGTSNPHPSSTASSPATTSPKVKPTPIAGSCAYNAANGTNVYTDGNNARYTIECGTDHNGGDIGGASAKTFVDCMYVCDKTDKCIAFAWVGGNGPGTCYLKGTVTGSEIDADVDYAYKGAATHLSASSAASTNTWSSVSSSAPSGVTITTVTSYSHSATPASVTSSSGTYEHQSQETKSHAHHTKPKPHWFHRPKHHNTKHHHTESSFTEVPYSKSSYTESIYTESQHSKHHHTKSHHTKSHRTKHHHIKSTTTAASLSSATVPATNSISTSCKTLTFSSSGTTRVSTITNYISQPSTQTNWVTSSSPATSAVSTSSGKPTPTTSAVSTSSGKLTPTTSAVSDSSEKPTKTYTNGPVQPTPAGDDEYCKSLRGEKPKKLRCEVVRGSRKFHGMWVRDPLRGE